jgi:glycosyltransferase involved in cell wall biosynthesis
VSLRRVEVVSNIVIANGRANPGEAGVTPIIVAAGALNPIKGYDVLIRALSLVAQSGTPFEMLLAGEGPERSRLESLASECGIGAQVRFLGEVEDVPSLFSSAHMLVHPSRCEGLSNTILEAMAEGLPVIATCTGGTPEIVPDNWQLIPPDRDELLAEKIRLLLANPGLRADLGRENLAVVSRRCSVTAVAGQFESIYWSVAKGTVRSPAFRRKSSAL